LLERDVSIDEAKLFGQYQNLFEFVQNEHQPNAIQCKMMKHERWVKYLQLTLPLNASANWQKSHGLTSPMWLITLMWNDFFHDAATNL